MKQGNTRVELAKGFVSEANLLAGREKDEEFGLKVGFDEGEEHGEFLRERSEGIMLLQIFWRWVSLGRATDSVVDVSVMRFACRHAHGFFQ